MAMLPPGFAPITRLQRAPPPTGGLEKVLGLLSVVTMLMTVPQVLAIWVGGDASGISLVSRVSFLFSACPWFVYGVQKHDKTISCLYRVDSP